MVNAMSFSASIKLLCQLFQEFININDLYLGKIYCPQYIKMMILSYDKTCVGLECAIHKFVIIGVLLYQLQVDINLDLLGVREI